MSLSGLRFSCLCFDIVTPHQLLNKSAYSQFRLYETSRCIIERFSDSRKIRALVTENTLVRAYIASEITREKFFSLFLLIIKLQFFKNIDIQYKTVYNVKFAINKMNCQLLRSCITVIKLKKEKIIQSLSNCHKNTMQ